MTLDDVERPLRTSIHKICLLKLGTKIWKKIKSYYQKCSRETLLSSSIKFMRKFVGFRDDEASSHDGVAVATRTRIFRNIRLLRNLQS